MIDLNYPFAGFRPLKHVQNKSQVDLRWHVFHFSNVFCDNFFSIVVPGDETRSSWKRLQINFGSFSISLYDWFST